MGKISVVIPTYNREYLLGKSVLSVLNQTYGDFELIIVDDGSTDQTRAKVSGYQDSRIKYLYKENGGVSSARNLGINHASGEYIGFLDSDDSWPENFLEVMFKTGGRTFRRYLRFNICRVPRHDLLYRPTDIG